MAEVAVEQSGEWAGRYVERGPLGDVVHLAGDQLEAVVTRLDFGVHHP
ncbi:hypothetical protein [Subtercola frigoramans]|uniref:Uncharacterized protein n=1 Tax=Subtercola frigoramans TaxID=120298 RepID=A0ABS2L715_9MICO|nr:hypothetical protein [Subtercola frigoramans]MBM7472520.1 hypothetical protein [Subtercola frigoramans]